MKTIAFSILIGMAVMLLVLATAIALGGPGPIAPLASINAPFARADFSGVPPPRTFVARDGTRLAWLHYPAAGTDPTPRRIVLVHGSSARGRSMHVLAQALADAGFAVAALDMRGHGDSIPRGQADYIGQLDDDIEDFLRAVPHAGPNTLAGFSSGGGFVLRFAGGPQQDLFDRYLLLAPYLHHDAPTNRPADGAWVSVGLPRLVALTLVNRLGITSGNHLPVLRFGLTAAAKEVLTSSYSYTLATNFRPRNDYMGDIRNLHQPLRIVAGRDDELFDAARYAGVFAEAGHPVPITLVDGVKHIGLTLDAAATAAIVDAARQ